MTDPLTEAARDLRTLSVTHGFDRLFIDSVSTRHDVTAEAVISRYAALYREAPESCARIDIRPQSQPLALPFGVSISCNGATQYFGRRFVLDGEIYVLALRRWECGADAFRLSDGQLCRFSETHWQRATLELDQQTRRAG